MTNLLKISEAASLALHTLVFLAGQGGERFSAKAIASELQGSEFHLSKVLQRLSRAGLVTSIRGPKGGFTISEEGEEAYLLDVFEAIEGPLELKSCIAGIKVCQRETCILGGLTDSIHQQFKEYMSKTRVKELMENRAARERLLQ
ncbi:MAG: Rrf2 family transcriptional regulator [Planctomycetota bacterium]